MERNLVNQSAAYSYSLNPLTMINDIVQNFESILEWDRIRVTGRVEQCNLEENYGCLTLKDESGEIKIIVNRSYIGEPMYHRLLLVGIEDIVRVDGARHLTADGEIAIKADRIQVMSKASRLLL